MNRIRIKICGITRARDAVTAANLGADAIGLVFYAPSPRNVTITLAKEIIATLPPFITKVALFVDEQPEIISTVLEQLPIDLLQFHGDESPEMCRIYSMPYIKAIRMRDDIDLASQAEHYGDAAGLLLDSYVVGVVGGTGTTFGWDRVPENINKPLILAGGLNQENVGDAINQVRPYAVDVSGGVESEKGIKDHAKMAAFVRAVRDAG